MTFLSTCCCRETESPPPTGCNDTCCKSCFSGDRIAPWSGNPIDLNDSLILYQGIGLGVGKDVNLNLTEKSPTLKFEYKKIGSYWIWWNPSYMLNYTTNVPECESTEYVSLSQVTNLYGTQSAPNNNIHKGKSAVGQGDACSHTLIPNQSTEFPDASDLPGFDDYHIYYGGGGSFKSFFSTLKGVAFGDDPFIINNVPQTVFQGTILNNSSSGPSLESGYPCSTIGEDECCYVENIFYAKYPNEQQRRNKNQYCNRMGISPYRRRIMEQHYPWAFQIFSYNSGLEWPFIKPVNYFEVNNPDIIASGKQLSNAVYATPLRLQFLGFIQCEHHWGLGEAGACNPEYENANYPLSYILPRRFIYGCSAIPFFEFDAHEYNIDGNSEIDAIELITNMRAFTSYFPNPIGNFDPYPDQPYPDQNNVTAVRRSLSLMAQQNFTNVIAKDWRQEAVEELIEAETCYREALGITGSTFDLFNSIGITRPISISGTVEDFRSLSDEVKTAAILDIFPEPLGPVRKRYRALTVAGYFGEIDWLSSYLEIDSGNNHNLALKDNGRLIAWGDNGSQQSTIPGVTGSILKFSAGAAHNIAFTRENELVCWGSNQYGQCAIPQGITLLNVREVSAGGAHTVVLTSNGITCWGAGLQDTGSTPNFGQSIVPSGIGSVRKISAGLLHTVALKANNNTVVCWGNNSDGQCSVPPTLINQSFDAISAGHYHTMALRSGQVECWGRDDNNQSTIPPFLRNNPNIVITKISAGGFHSVALDRNGIVYCWGDNSYGQSQVPGGLGPIVAISAGEFHTTVLLADGSLFVFGRSDLNQTTPPSETGPIPTLVNVLMPYDVLGGTKDFLFTDERGSPVEEYRPLQAMTYADVFEPLEDLNLFRTSYEGDTVEQLTLRQRSLIAKLSQITYTYFLMQPGKWDFSAWGPGLAGPSGKPEDNFYFRKYGYVQDPDNGLWPSFARVLAHSQLRKCISFDPNESDVDFAWNPSTNCVFGNCIRHPEFESPTLGLVVDPYCGRSTYSETPDVLVGAHSYPVGAEIPPDTDICVDRNGFDHTYDILDKPGKAEVSFVRYASRGMTWDTSVVPHRVISMPPDVGEEYKTKPLRVRLRKTFDNCIVCHYQGCRTNPYLNDDSVRAFNARCSPVPSYSNLMVSGCEGIKVENTFGSPGPDSNIPPYNNNNNAISYDFGWQGPIAFKPGDPYNFDPVEEEDLFTIPGVTFTNPEECAQFDFCDSLNRTVNNSLNSLSDPGITWMFGLPPNKYWEIPGITAGIPQYPYGVSYSDFVGMFTLECCELIEKCAECRVGQNFAEDCANRAHRWCRCPKYPESGVSAWVLNGGIQSSPADLYDPWNKGIFGGTTGMVLGFGRASLDNSNFLFTRFDKNPADGSILSTVMQGPINRDDSPQSNLNLNNAFEFNRTLRGGAGGAQGRTSGCCSPVYSGSLNSGRILFGSDKQFECSKIMFNVTEQQLRSIGFTDQIMIDRYKGSFCGCSGIYVDTMSQSGFATAEENNDCIFYDTTSGDCKDLNYEPGFDPPIGYRGGRYRESVINNTKTRHKEICKYIANSLCSGLDMYGGGIGKFRVLPSPCPLDSGLFNGIADSTNPFSYGTTGVRCTGERDYLYDGYCYVAPEEYIEPGVVVFCQDNGPDNPIDGCFDNTTSTPLDVTSSCCQECLEPIQGTFEFNSYDCSGCSEPDGDIFVFDDPIKQSNSTWSDTAQLDFADWARSRQLLGCWRKKEFL